MKRVLVTGGAGFIGSHVVEQLLQSGCDVAVIDSLKNGRREFIAKIDDREFYQVDLCDRQKTYQAINEIKPDTAIHLAAIHFIPYCDQHPLEAMQVNIMGTRHLLEALEQSAQLQRCFFASTAAVYPIAEVAHRETDHVQPMDIYGITKVAGEVLFKEFSQRRNIPVVIGRLFNAVGPHETNPHLLPDIIAQLQAGKSEIALGNLTPQRDFIDVRDMAKAIVILMQKAPKQFEVFNIGAGKQYSVVQVVELCEKILARKIKIIESAKMKRVVERQKLLAAIDKIHQHTGWLPTIDLASTLKDLLLKI